MQHDQYAQELQMAKKVQQGLLSVEPPQIPGFKIEKRCIPADNVGGDFYVFKGHTLTGGSLSSSQSGIFQYQDQRQQCLDIVLGDVAGHGVSSALVMALTSGLLGEILKTAKSPSQILELTNNTLIPYLENSQIRYVTGISARFYPQNKKMLISNAGHPPALLLRRGQITPLSQNGLFLGMFDNEDYPLTEVALEKGDRIIFYTDGLLEARNPQGEEFGSDRWEALIRFTSKSALSQQLEDIYFGIASFSQSEILKDDQTLVMVEVD